MEDAETKESLDELVSLVPEVVGRAEIPGSSPLRALRLLSLAVNMRLCCPSDFAVDGGAFALEPRGCGGVGGGSWGCFVGLAGFGDMTSGEDPLTIRG